MSWMRSIWVAAALLALCKGENTVYEGNSLSASGYHLCIHNETRTVSFLVMHKVPYTATKPCGSWLVWKTCSVTLYRMIHQTEYKTVVEQVTKCCDGYVQVGRYCALSVNTSGKFIAKPGSCPTADGLHPGSEDCEWDMDCPGWQKCCQGLGRPRCSHPGISANDSENGGHRLNVTVTVKIDHQQLMAKDGGLFNHTRLLQAMVTGALQSDDVSVYYLSSWPVHPYRTATSLLVDCDLALSLNNVTSKLHLLLKHIQEVSSVTVEDVDECAVTVLSRCSTHAVCNNTVGSYHCTCPQGYTDADPSNTGIHCTADVRVWTTTETLQTHLPSMNTTSPPASSTTQPPQGNSTSGVSNSSEISMTTALSNTSSVPYNSSHAPQWTSSAPHTSMSSAVELSLPTTTCSPPSITALAASNITRTSFCVYWSTDLQMSQTYRVALSKGSEVIEIWETSQTMMEMRELLPGALYYVTVTPCACGSQGATLRIAVRTDAQTLDATARLTNLQFTADLQNTSSQAYKNLTASIIKEICLSLSPEMKAMVDSGQVRIEIRGFSPGSVVVNFNIIFSLNQSQNINNVSIAVLNSLMNSSKYTVDRNNTSINDFNECASGEHDCSQWATCTNTWASFTCVCQGGYMDKNPERPGRACQVIATSGTMAPSPTLTIFSTAGTTPVFAMTPQTSDPALTSVTTAPELTTTIISTSEMVSTTVTSATLASSASAITTTTAAATIPALPTSTTAVTAALILTTHTPSPKPSTSTPTTSISTTAPTFITTDPTITTTALITTSDPTVTTTDPTTTSTAPTNITTDPTTTITPPTSITTDPTTTTTPPTSITTDPTTTTTPPTNITTDPTTISTDLTATTTDLTSTTTDPTTTTTNPVTTSSAPITTTTAMTSKMSTYTTTITTPTTTAPAPTNNATDLRIATNVSMLGAISVQCRVAAITVTITREFLQKAKIRESTIYLGLPECGANGGNATHVQLTVAWNECTTQLVHNETFYTASVTLLNNMDPYISTSGAKEAPRIRLEVPIMCTYMKSMLLSADFGSTGYNMIKDVITGLGSFQVRVQLMNGTVPLPHNYSMSPEDVVVVEVSLNTSSKHIKVVINKCWATPTPNPADTYSDTFLENSCSLNTYTKVLMNGNSSTSRVSVQIFSFVKLSVIYLHCQVHICVQLGSDTCVPDCLQRTARTSNMIGSAFGSSGPLLRSDEETFEGEYDTLHIVGLSCLGVGLSLFFIIGFVCLFYYQRNRIGHYNFSVKPKQENFTYLVFNT